MPHSPNHIAASHTASARSPYHKPAISKVDLTLEETLATGCKETVEACVQPPATAFNDIGS